MPQQFPSIQSFFQPEVSPAQEDKASNSPLAAGDGFTAEEVEATIFPPSLPHWQPRGIYEEVDIETVIPGPGCVTIMGRVVNFFVLETPSKAPHAAKGCLKMVVKDDTGALVVRLWYDKIDYRIRLGQLVSIWTPHVSSAESNSITAQNAALMTSIFPEKDNSCYFLIQEKSDDGTMCKMPMGYQEDKQLPGLMTLKSFLEGGHEVLDAKVLVCVKSIGGRKTFTTKKGRQAEKVDVGVFDDTSDATLQLWNCLAMSSSAWKVSSTILLMSSPGLKTEGRPTLTIDTKTHVDIDPCMTDAFWLRRFAQNLTKREHVNPPFPKEVFDTETVETALTSEQRVLYTLADIDEFARVAPHERLLGWISVILLEMNIMSLQQRSMMFCHECCGVPIFAKKHVAKCKQCDKDVELGINPRIVGMLIDETGNIGCGKLIWAPAAWEQLLGRTAEDFAECNTTVLKYLEHRLLFLRYNLFVGWSEEVGKLTLTKNTPSPHNRPAYGQTLQQRESHFKKIPLLANIWFQMRKAPPYLGSTAKAVVAAVGVLLVVLEIGLVRLKWQGRHRMIVESHPLTSPPSATVLSCRRFRSPDAGLPANLSLQPSLSSEMCLEVLAQRLAPSEQKNYTCKDVSTQPSAPQNDGTDVQAALTAVLATAEGLVSPLTGDILTRRSLVSPAEEDIIEIATVLDLPRVNLMNLKEHEPGAIREALKIDRLKPLIRASRLRTLLY